MEILVTGAAGFLGTHIVEQARAAGHRVRTADLPEARGAQRSEPSLSGGLGGGATHYEVDVSNEAHVKRACDEVDAVIHAAGIFHFGASLEKLHAVNVDGARLVAEHAPRMVAISSTGVYGKAGTGTREDAAHRPRNAYERTKSEGERAATEVCARRGIRMVALRPTLIYGPKSRYGLAVFLSQLALRAARGLKSLPLLRGGWLGHHVHVVDVARAAVLLAERDDASGAFNVADDQPLSTSELVTAMLESLGIGTRSWPLPWSLVGGAARIPGLLSWLLAKQNPKLERAWKRLVEQQGLVAALTPELDAEWLAYMTADYSYETGRLRALGFRCEHPDVRVGIAETVRWYREMRWLP